MNLICFPNNCGGGLLCSLLNNTNSEFSGYAVNNLEHSEFKLKDENMNDYFDLTEWIRRSDKNRNKNLFFGTHFHPSIIPNLAEFDQILCVTTTSRISKLYRWLRFYYGYLKNPYAGKITNNIESDLWIIDTVRETAKLFVDDFVPDERCENIEFHEIVEGSYIYENNLDIIFYEKCRSNNSFLYSITETDFPVLRFNEALWEIDQRVPFRYL